MSTLYIADTFILLALGIIWSTSDWFNKAVKLFFYAMVILHVWGGAK